MKTEDFIEAYKKLNENDLMMGYARHDFVRKSVTQNGFSLTHTIAMEECAELAKECSKYIRGIGFEYDLIQEIADVYIVLHSLELVHNIDPVTIDRAITVKLGELGKKMEVEKKEGIDR